MFPNSWPVIVVIKAHTYPEVARNFYLKQHGSIGKKEL